MADSDVLPADLSFRFQLNKQLFGTITINNPHDQRLAWKVKTTAPKKYVVRPSSGVASPKESVNVQVIMQAQKEYPPDYANCKDKFMVQTAVLAAGEEVDDKTFLKDGGSRVLKEARLRVILEAPPRPSPVAEVGEGADAEEAAAAAPATTARAASGSLPAGAAAAAPRAGAAAGGGDAAFKASAETSTLKAQLTGVTRDRDDLRRRVDVAEQRSGGKPGGHGAADSKKAGFSMLYLILAAVLAFLVGNYMRARYA